MTDQTNDDLPDYEEDLCNRTYNSYVEDLCNRTYNSCEELMRYGDRVFTEPVADLLSAVCHINDDLWHMRHSSVVKRGIEEARKALDEIEKGLTND